MSSLSRTVAATTEHRHPPRAVVGSQINVDEEMFGAAFDRRVVRRFFGYVSPV